MVNAFEARKVRALDNLTISTMFMHPAAVAEPSDGGSTRFERILPSTEFSCPLEPSTTMTFGRRLIVPDNLALEEAEPIGPPLTDLTPAQLS